MFNTAALLREPSPEQLADLTARRRTGQYGDPGGTSLARVLAGAVFLVFFLAVFGFVANAFISVGRETRSRLFQWLPLLFGGFMVLALGQEILLRRRRAATKWQKLALFARDNDLGFALVSGDPGYPGAIFGVGTGRHVTNRVWADQGRFASAGHYVYKTGSGDDETTHLWTYLAFRLPRPLPHLVLDAKANDGADGKLAAGYQRQQRLALGGLFDQHYTLLAPEGYGADAYQLFTPDVIEALTVQPLDLDLEIVDDWLLLYAKGTRNLTDPDFWQEVDRVQGTIVEPLVRGSGRYLDRRPEALGLDEVASDAVAPDEVAPDGVASDGVGPKGARAAVPAALGSAPDRPAPQVAPQGRRLRESRLPALVTTGLLMLGLVVLDHFDLLTLFP